MAWNKFEWFVRIIDSTGCATLTKHCDDGDLTYYGQVNNDDIPNGFGSISQNGHYIKQGLWDNGEFIISYGEEDYNIEMNRIQNYRRH